MMTGLMLAAALAAGVVQDEAWLQQTNLLQKGGAARVEKLPDVLILGDSISLGYTEMVKARLKDVANVSRPACNCGPSQFYLRSVKDWVGTNRWDVIHVNFGIWDNHYLKGASDGMDLYWGREVTNALPPIAKGTAIRDLGFRIRTPAKEYEKNLRTVLGYLKTHADRVVFGLTTPLRAWQGDDRCGRIRVYNEIATAVCEELDVGVDDLYAVAERNLDKQSDGVHYYPAGYEALAESVVASVTNALRTGRCPVGGANAHIRAKIADCDRYAALNPHFAKAFAFLKRGDLVDLKPGRYEIDGDNCWATVQEVKLTPFADGAKVEAHRKYIDIQSPLTGEETIGETTMDEKLRALPFDEEKDFVLFDAPSRPVTLKPGEFAIYFPPDGAHAPGHCEGEARTIRKLVIKVRAERPAAGGLVVDPAKESMDFSVPKGLKGFAWGKLQWDAKCAVAVERTGNLPADVVARASKYPGGRILVYACRTNDAPGKVDFTISLAAGNGTLRGAKAFAVDAADRQVETVAHCDNYGRMLVSLGPREGLLVDVDPFAQMPFVDLSGETNRQFVIAEGTPTFYNGHPTMTACETPDHLIAVWTSGHGGSCGPAAESLDGGKTWTRIDERFPAEWKKAINCPSIYYLKGPDGKSRLWAWANAFGKRELASMMPSVMSEDNGRTWKLMPPLGERFRCVMAFTSVVRLPDGRYFAAFHRSQKAIKGGWQDVAPHEVAGTFSSDGGFTWSDPFVVASDPAGEEWYCEPGVFLSPDGTELCCLLREQHRGLSRMCFSKDFGKTWSKPVPTSRGVSGHRHVAHVLPDGRVAVALRSWYQPLENPRRDPHFGCWIGPYSSIRAGTDADAVMVKLLEPKPGKAGYGSWDTGYPAFAINAAGEIVAATYIHYRADENRHSIAGIRFDPRQLFEQP